VGSLDAEENEGLDASGERGIGRVGGLEEFGNGGLIPSDGGAVLSRRFEVFSLHLGDNKAD
jgi:hypothetical protein